MSDLTTGPNANEGSTTYHYGGVAHKIIVLDKISSDIMLAHQARMAGFYLKLGGSTELLTPVPRAAKDLILKGV